MKNEALKQYRVDFETEEQAKVFRKLLKVLKIKEIKDPNAPLKPKATKKEKAIENPKKLN